MDRIGQAAVWLRDLLGQQPWLDAWQLAIAQTPDWALLSIVPVFVATLWLLVFIMGPRGAREPRAKQTREQPVARARPAATSSAPSAPKSAAPPPREAAGHTATAPSTTATSDARATGIPADSDQDRGVRVFVSSTFLDMQGERDELVRTTFLDLRRQFRERGVELLEVDLRWGVTEQDVTLDVCLSEVNRCKPYFIGLLGQRYGTLLTDRELTPELLADFPVLSGAVGCSLTEIEIMQGVLSDADTAKHALFFERDPAWLGTLDEAQRVSFEEQSEPARAKLADLKTRIRNSAATVHEYKAPSDVGDAVKAALSAALEASFPQAEAPDAFTQTHRLHAAYARDRLGPHIGAELYIGQLDQWMRQAYAPPLLITGASGGGKSKLLAKWLQAQGAKSGNDILFAHYLGASPDSADPMQVMRRLWEHLNRATGESVDLPGGNADLMDVASGLGQRIAQANAFAERDNCHILIALDGLDKLSSESNLRWLPTVLPPRVKLVASSLDGEAKTAALTRGWSELAIKLLDVAGQSAFIASTLKDWGKSDLPPERKQRILAHPLAGLPLFLKTVLEELRVSATNAVLDVRLGDYLKAQTMAELFDGVLERLERDCGQALVERALSLIEASRAGLEEAELIAITGATPLAWAKLRNGLGDSLRDQAGRVAFSHDYLSQAVKARYLASDDERRAAHLAIADQFEKREPDERQAEELPYQLQTVEAWERLEALLINLDRFNLLRARGDVELLSYWLPLKTRGRDPETLLCGAFRARAEGAEQWSLSDLDLATAISTFLYHFGSSGDVLVRIVEQSVAASRRLNGPDHPKTNLIMNNLAVAYANRGDFIRAQQALEGLVGSRTGLLDKEDPKALRRMLNLAEILREKGDLAGAELLLERLLEYQIRQMGPEHQDTLASTHYLARTLLDRGDLARAQQLEERVFDVRSRVLGPEHLDTLTSAAALARVLFACGDLAGAQQLEERVLKARTRVLGPDHPATLISLNNLAVTLSQRGDIDGSLELKERALEGLARLHGSDHPATLASTDNLAGAFYARGDVEGARKLAEQVLEARTRVLGREHPDTLTSMNNLAVILKGIGDIERAQDLGARALEARIRVLGPEHPHTLTSMNNLAQTLYARGDVEGARKLEERALDARTRVLGPDHPDTIGSMKTLLDTLRASGQAKDLVDAWELGERLLEARMHVLGPEHPDTLKSMYDLAALSTAVGDLEGAQRLEERLVEARTRLLGAEHPNTLASIVNLATTMGNRGELAAALVLAESALAGLTNALGPDSTHTVAVAQMVASMRADLERQNRR